MTDREQIAEQYRRMYRAMVEKDSATLEAVHAPEFVLVHMTGMRQSKPVYIQSILNGTLNYYSAVHEQMDIKVDGDHATLVGRSRVEAAVFGGGCHTWPLQLRFHLVRLGGQWLFTEAQASTY
ncbi:MAG: nuclear transport factor 2 family protein [Bacteroidaceae bacterium]|nr:nuclear transport factor 2 family protein [Bacteroidaceae bacterium]